MTLQELYDKRANLITEARKILDTAEAETRDVSSEEQEQWDRYMADVDKVGADIKREERLAESEREQREAERAQSHRPRLDPNADPGSDGGDAAEERANCGTQYADAFWHYMREGRQALSADEYGRMTSPEVRALSVGTDTAGGYTVPDEFERQMVEALDDENVMRGLCTVINTMSGTREIPVVASQGAAAWTSEAASYNESDDAWVQVTLSAYKATRIIKVSEELLHDSAFNLSGYLATSFGRAFGNAEETAFVNGDGSGKPTGIVGGSSLGVTAAGAAAITADELIDLYHAPARSYRRNGTFMTADGTVKLVRKLKDGDNQYLWQPGLQAGQPDRLLGRPLVTSSDMPAATTGLKSMLFGDFSYYWIADREARTFQRLDELYAASGQVGFRGAQRVDGKLTLNVAVKHLIQA